MELTRSTLVALTKDRLPLNVESPTTVNAVEGAEVPIPTLLSEALTNKVSVSICVLPDTVSVEFRVVAPLALRDPLMSRVAPGRVVPIPIFELDSYMTLLTKVLASLNLDK